MENNIENKAKFFGLYFGQTVVHTGIGRAMKQLGKRVVLSYENSDKFQSLVFSNQRAVELKTISSISDEDAIEVAKIACPMLFHTYTKGHVVDRSEKDWITVKHDRNIKSVDIDFDGYVCVCNEDLNYERNPYGFSAIRKLQELGYYVGDGTEVEYGWVKLKESEVSNG
ncbi:hypothetical protein [Sphingobacterium multivorum]|uniref:hypothetical protein n=1 Tax=Sphingobacterium multivorum TaxID=28454 RepID=UPI003DA1EF38